MKPSTDHIDLALKKNFSEDFVQKMRNRVATSSFKYGNWDQNDKNTHFLATAMLEIISYLETGNTEYLVDAANYCMAEFMLPSVPGAGFEAGDSHKSPGVVTRRLRR